MVNRYINIRRKVLNSQYHAHIFLYCSAQHPGVGGIRFSIPKRNKMQQQNGETPNYPPQPPNPNFNHQRYMGPRPPRAPMMHNNPPNNSNSGSQPEPITRNIPTPAPDLKARYVGLA